MSQRQQLERIFEIDRQIRDGRYPNAQQLAATLEVSSRVIFLDRQFMVDRLGAPIQFDRRRGGWYYANSSYALPSVMVTEGELLAFFLSVEIAQRSLGKSMEQDLRSAVTKISANLKGPVTVDLGLLKTHYTFAMPAISTVNEKLLMDIHTAIRENRQMHIYYYTASRNAHTDRVVDPYHLYNLHGDWYLIGYDHLRGAFRNFLAGRIEKWVMLDDTFQPSPGFDIDTWMGQAFQAERGDETAHVVICFDAYQARYIKERRWHESQQIEDLPDGGLILRFSSGGLNEVKRWVMQYGDHAEVIAPEELRKEVIGEVQKMVRRYQQSVDIGNVHG